MTCFNPFLFLVFFKWLKKTRKIPPYRFVLEPAISDDGSCHSWELLTKDIIAPARNNASAPAFSFSTLTESDKLALFTRQIELLSVFDFSLVDNKPISLNIDDLLSSFYSDGPLSLRFSALV